MNKSSFSLLKEKIIKTDAVITLVAEKSNKIKELEEKLKMLYKRYMDKSKENEALHHQAKMCELEHRPLKEQIKELQNQCSESESKYDSLLNASEIKYQSLGVELEVCKREYKKLLKNNKHLQKSNVTAPITKRMRRYSETVQCKDKMQLLTEKVEILKSQVVRLSEKSDRDDDELNYFRTNYGKILPCEDVVPKSVHVKKLDGLKSQQLDELEQMRCKYAGETSELKEKIDELEVAQRSLRMKLKAMKLQNKSMGDRLASLSVEKDCMENLLQVNASSQLTENSYESKDNSLETKIDECYDEEGLRWSKTDDDDVSMERVDDIFNEMINVPSFLSPFHTSCSTEDLDSLPEFENEGGNEEIIKSNEEEVIRIEDSCHNDYREIDTKKDINSNIENEIMSTVASEIERNEASIVLNENSEVGPSEEDKQIDRNHQDTATSKELDSLLDFENEGWNEEIIKSNDDEDTRIEDSSHNVCRKIDTKEHVNSEIEDEIMSNIASEIVRNEASIVLNENSEVDPSNEDKKIDRNHQGTAISKELDSLPDFENEGGNEEIIKSNEEEDIRIEDSCHNYCKEIDTKKDDNSNIGDEMMSNVASEIERNEASIVLNENCEVRPSNKDKQIDRNHQDTAISKELESSNEENINDNKDITLNNDGDVKSNVEISFENQEMIKRKKEENVTKNNDVMGIGIPEITITPPTPPTAQLSEFCFVTPSSGEAKTGTVPLKEDPISIVNIESESNVNDVRDLNAQSKETKAVLDCNLNGFACTSIQTTKLQDDRSEAHRIKIANTAIKRKKARLWNNKVKALKKEIFISVVKYVNRKFSMGQKRPYGINLLEIQKSKFNCIYRSRKLRMMRWKLLRESNTYNTDTESDICRRTRLRTRKARRRTKPNKIDSKMVDNSVQLGDLSDDASRLIADTEQEYKEITRNYNELEFFFNALNNSCGTHVVKISEPDRETQLEINKNDEMNELQNNDTFEYEISSVDSGYFKSDSETFEVHKDRNVKTYGVGKKCHRASTAKKNTYELGQLKEDHISISSVENHLLANVPLVNDLCVTTDTFYRIPDAIIDDKIDQEPNFDSQSISVDLTQQLFGSDCSLMSIEDLNVTEVLNTCGVDLDNIEMFPADFISSQESFTTNDFNTKNKTSEESHIDINCTNVGEKPDATSDNKKKCRKRKRNEKGAFDDLTDKDELQENTKPKLVKPLENNDVRVNQNGHKQTMNSKEKNKKTLQRRWDSVIKNKTLPRKTSTSTLEKLPEGKNELKKSCITKNPKSVKSEMEVDSPQAKVTPLNKPIVAKSCETFPSAETSLAALEKRLKEDDGSSCAGTVKNTIRVIRAASLNTFARKLKRPNCFKRIANSPKSPEPQVAIEPTAPIIIPLNAQRPMSPVTASTLFKRMLCFPNKPAVLEEVAERCKFQDKDHLSRLIISEVSEDTLHNPDTNYTPPAPVLTETQRVLLGLMHKLDSTHLPGLLNSFMCQVEKHLLFNTEINCLQPVTRLYLAVCKFRKDIDRMRRMICDALYFMNELVIPFLFTVLSTWIELLPLEINSNDEPIIKVLIQVVNSKTCNRPGYNLMNLRKLLQGYYGYPKERGNPDEIFQDVFKHYLRTPTKSIEYSLIIMCKNHPTNWVFQQINLHLKPAVMNEQDVHVRASVLRIIGYILKQFDPKNDAIVLKNIDIWLKVVCDDPLLLEIKEYVQKTIEMIPNS